MTCSFTILARYFALVMATVLLGVSAAIAQAQQPASKATSPPAGNVEDGKEHFKKYGCYACHGYSGYGGAGPRVTQPAISFQAFVAYVRQPKGSMPPYGSQVSEAELADIYVFLKSVPPSPAAKSIPLLND